MSKRTKAGNLFGMGEERAGVKPDSDEFKAVMNSGGLKSDIANRHKTLGTKGTSTAANIKSIKIHPQADTAYWFNKSFQDHKTAGANDQNAARAATEGYQIDPVTKMSVKPGAANEFAAPETMKDAVVTDKERKVEKKAAKTAKDDTKTDKPETADDIIDRLFGKEVEGKRDGGLLSKGLTEFAKVAPGVKLEEEQQKKTETKLDNLKAMTASRDAAMQPFVTQTEEAPIMGGEENEIIVPGNNKNDADDFLMPKFGVLTEFTSTLSNLM